MSARHTVDPLEVYTAWGRARAEATVVDAVRRDRRGADASVHAAIAARVEQLRPELTALAVDLHANPEVGFEEVRSAARIADLLEAHGAEVERGAFALPTAFRATRGTGGPHFAVVAEYDALPGIGHACGHNIIAAIAVGAFLAASDVVRDGRVSIIGAPAEEGGGGKELILRAGGFDDVDAAGMVHPSTGDDVGAILGGGTSGVRRLVATYHGRAGHAALSPYLGLNALDAVVTAYQSIAQLRQHILPVDRIHGIITDGGAAANVVPERASAEFLIRSDDIATLDVLVERVVAILEAAALSTGTRLDLDLDFVPAYLPLRPNVTLTERWATALERRGRVVPLRPRTARQGGPSTDMGNVSWFVPSIHPTLGLGAAPGVLPHNAAFADSTVQPAAFDALVDAAIALAGAAADFVSDEELRADVAAEFAATGGRRRVAP
ncbi:amidohydrolase [Microbacterium trichothecenolyticum]|uniref:Peptidase M20 domain-containing protein 2 n=1 Tax=Microbacterium trichothecenolyticum TaxID=69370 RepID=A0ABU0TUW0_MICTR|nr:amidohydrolase [Microbacterium trichothecenolyticum]MDQ1123447.1 amidohydrolase [Microbacterium trichothecenolyticum]